MISYSDARRAIEKEATRRAIADEETVALPDALGRVSARALKSRIAIPSFDNSAMDGYAVAASALGKIPARLPVLGAVFAGDPPRRRATGAGAWRIMTGAPLPAGCDAVVPVEKTRALDGGAAVELLGGAAPGDFVRGEGRDFPPGAEICPPGTRLGARHLLALAAAGVARAAVLRRPRVALLTTGRELTAPGAPLRPGRIHDASSAYLAAAVPALGARFDFRGIVADDRREFRRRLRAAAAACDVVLATGAVSMGEADFIPAALKEFGAETVFHKIAIRPGKPLLFARLPRGPLFFGLPGNPISTVVGLRFFVEPCLRAMLGRPPERPRRRPLAARVKKPAGLRCFFKARRRPDGSVRVLPGQASFQIHSLLSADCWAVLPETGDSLAAGTAVETYPLSETSP